MGVQAVDTLIRDHENSGKYFSVNGLNTFALDFGKGEAVVCIHGVPTSSFLYRKLLRELQVFGFRAISIDLPGLGLSDRPENFDYSFSNFSQFLLQAINELEVDKFHLVVHDIGGPIGFALAGTNLERILSLTILNTWIDVVNYSKPMVMKPLEKSILGEAEVLAITHETWPVMFRKIGIEKSNAVSSDEMNVYVDLLKRQDKGKAFLKIMRNFEYSPAFRELCYRAVQSVPYPVQAIWGVNDPALTFKRYGLEIKKVAALGEVTKLPSRHLLQEEVWSSIAQKIFRLTKEFDS